MDLLQNENIRLRALEPEDLELLYHWENNPEWWELGSTISPYSRYMLKEYIAGAHRDIYEQRQLRLMIDFLPMNATIGMIDLYDFEPHHHRAGIGILIDPLYQKKGLATEALVLLEKYAFSFLKLHQLYVHIPTKNESSKALFACCGYTITGILTDWIVAEDGYSDVLTMQKIYRNIPTEI
ncbi:GNAT family N-acetyltransferase [Parabacteroides sp. AM08-6]|uniref:GNAT family N-acetyltransferase n=1 Tax=Parabacteroides sp. AM08-6 TaxID=2292053 RepID=UPI000EFE23EA|nr:GNAT family N-acetyltransferase [Parabacteroides sp. AM08-6]RHJ83271.1 N-acetyltransferase [Parabacteroides sp. AM08-6]